MHERMGRMTNLWLREAGRTDPLVPTDMWSAGEQSMGQWGLTGSIGEEETKILNRRDKRLQRIRSSSASWEVRNRKEQDAHRLWRQDREEFRERTRKLAPDSYNHVKLHPHSLVYHSGADSIELVRFIGKRRDLLTDMRSKAKGEHRAAILLNGDGFDSREMQGIQALLRDRVQRQFGQNQVLVIPHMALTAAGIRIETIKRIQVTRDGHDAATVTLPKIHTEIVRHMRARAEASLPPLNKAGGPEDTGLPQSTPNSFRNGDHREMSDYGNLSLRVTYRGEEMERENWMIHYQPENGAAQWYTIQNPVGQTPTISVAIHRLGASVFSAVGPDGKRHRYVSAFDSNENPPMYFLAQVPDQGRCHSYEEAINLLAPPMVHEARRQGKRIYRQGDVFFIETNLTDQMIRAQGGTIHEGFSLKTGMPYKTRNIYGTGHIATSVARLPNGVTLAGGHAEHFPALTEPGRQPEHHSIELLGARWFLCVRNQVPRLQTQDSATRRGPRSTTTTGRRTRNARATA